MRIAIVGAGISGLVAAYLLSDEHDIVVYEANDYIGGHTHTIDVQVKGQSYAVDTGFIVFNQKTYPNFIKLIQKLGVARQPSKMSFSLQDQRSGLYFCPSSFNSLFAQRKNLFRPSFYRMLMDALRFRRDASKLVGIADYRMTLRSFLKTKGYSRAFIEQFIIPMGAAIWSSDPVKYGEFPARYFAEFLDNHSFLNIRNQPQWLVIKGGSKQYIGPLTQPFRTAIRLKTPVSSVQRFPDRVAITANGETDEFDQVVLAVHSDQALQMLADPTELERSTLGAIPYQENLTVLHTDISVLPPKQSVWASWNYHIPREVKKRVALTYDMSILQSLNAPEEFCVTLNMPEAIDPQKVIQKLIYHHPVYDPIGLDARRSQDRLNGRNRTYYCGAYWGYGFHEDGVKSALAVCKHFGKDLS